MTRRANGLKLPDNNPLRKRGRISRVFDARKAREVLETAGVEFVAENDGGAGVRLRKA
jgi:hypothetical protein